MIRRLLIANRGEIAARVARTARALGIVPIGIFSEADRGAAYLDACGDCVEAGPAAPRDSYLSIPRILDAARRSRADAVHPGYGFQSENAEFARAVIGAGLTWVGPPPDAIAQMGGKIESRRLMESAGVPVVPGFSARPGARDEELARGARSVGFPLLIKASAGGGGKGMRRVDSPDELPAALAAARREALAAFGDGEVYLERLIERPRHVEVQVLGDESRVVALSERECSIQRRHQKIVEEAPCAALPAETRGALLEAAVRAATSVAYRSAGTVEFLLAPDGAFHFLEMNTRLQVEHPVTEETLGIDLVAAQIEIAQGARIPAAWEALSPRGHAIESRVCAEDPETFLPRSGTILEYEEPRGPGVRVDSGVARGSRVGIEYDSLLAKLIVWGPDRETAAARMRRALSDYVILGVTTNIELLARVFEDPRFEEGRTHTGFLAEMPPVPAAAPPEAALAAAAWAIGAGGRPASGRDAGGRAGRDPWRERSGWRLA